MDEFRQDESSKEPIEDILVRELLRQIQLEQLKKFWAELNKRELCRCSVCLLIQEETDYCRGCGCSIDEGEDLL